MLTNDLLRIIAIGPIIYELIYMAGTQINPDRLTILNHELTALCVCAVFFGLYLPTLFNCIKIIVSRSSRGEPQQCWIPLVVVVLSLLLALHFGLSVLQLRKNFHSWLHGNYRENGCHSNFWYDLAKSYIVSYASLISEATLVYRCWHVYRGQSRVYVAIPTSLWLCGLALLTSALSMQGQSCSESYPVKTVYASFWALTSGMNIITTC
ncbi:hypothetical protein NP233_g9315 [Leucocoprinus birnbaumii]|uniref:Uncharacterized protein n=1 Tax=Leucocoprinus birnbaumii TaxID=56174 RepID=A0AAD5VP68_9AGAR|nr:hypothetical protein NP233_g9315 [Leucocoprinus birnbaumii]